MVIIDQNIVRALERASSDLYCPCPMVADLLVVYPALSSDLTKSSSESTLSACSNEEFNDSASTIPYYELPDQHIDSYSVECFGVALSTPSSDCSENEEDERVLTTHHFIPDREPAPYAESLIESDDEPEPSREHDEEETPHESDKEEETPAPEIVIYVVVVVVVVSKLKRRKTSISTILRMC